MTTTIAAAVLDCDDTTRKLILILLLFGGTVPAGTRRNLPKVDTAARTGPCKGDVDDTVTETAKTGCGRPLLSVCVCRDFGGKISHRPTPLRRTGPRALLARRRRPVVPKQQTGPLKFKTLSCWSHHKINEIYFNHFNHLFCGRTVHFYYYSNPVQSQSYDDQVTLYNTLGWTTRRQLLRQCLHS